MFSTIAVALDGSEAAERTLPVLRKLAAPGGASVEIVHVQAVPSESDQPEVASATNPGVQLTWANTVGGVPEPSSAFGTFPASVNVWCHSLRERHTPANVASAGSSAAVRGRVRPGQVILGG